MNFEIQSAKLFATSAARRYRSRSLTRPASDVEAKAKELTVVAPKDASPGAGHPRPRRWRRGRVGTACAAEAI